MIGLFQILGAGGEVLRLEHLHLTSRVDANSPLDGEGIAGHREGIIGLLLAQQIQTLSQIVRLDKGGRGVDAAHLVRGGSLLLQLTDGMGHHRYGAGVVIGQGCRAQERHLGAIGACHLGDLGIVGRYQDAIEAAALAGHLDGAGNHGQPAEVANVLARYALATAACRDHRDSHTSTSRRAATTSSCWAAVKVGNMGMLIASA
ncbi:hypothetical protein D3C86_1552870 [compost metagenome]